jgi:two-component system sensor histidine kinase YesM
MEKLRELRGNKGYISTKFNNTNYYMAYYHIGEYDWWVVQMIPTAELIMGNKSILVVTFQVLLISLIFSISLSYFISNGIVKPIKELTETMKKVKDENLMIQTSSLGEDEIGELGATFNYMIERINTLFQDVVNEQKKKNEAEYRALQAQMNPHFLYNTLNSIQWMAKIQKATNIKDTIEALGRLLRNSTSKVEEFITIAEEIAILEDYIFIEKMRYSNKFDVCFDVNKDILEYKCLKFILQPFVENAIFHGLEPKEGFGMIWISGKRIDDKIIFCIKDDGIGISEDTMRTISNIQNIKSKSFSGIGMGLVNNRIKMTFGNEYGVKLESEEGKYTCVYISLPIIE